jgi:hypothetical protein
MDDVGRRRLTVAVVLAIVNAAWMAAGVRPVPSSTAVPPG